MARRHIAAEADMPGRRLLNWPNRITLTRVVLVFPFTYCLLNLQQAETAWLRWAAVAMFAVMAFSDLLDGYLARRFHDESPPGKFLDPLADKLLITAALLILCIKGVPATTALPGQTIYLPNWVVLTALGKDLLVCIGFALIFVTTGRVFIHPRMSGKLCTTIQLILVLWLLLQADLPARLHVGRDVLQWASAAIAVIAAADYIRVGLRYVAANAK